MEYISTIFEQVLRFVGRGRFEEEVQRVGADRYTKHFTAWNQFIVNLYAQVTGKKSLRDIEVGMRMHQPRWYHWGLKNVARSTISYANSKRSWKVVEVLFYETWKRCRDVSPRYRFRFKNPLLILDATTLDLCLTLFPWARFQRRKGALKIHALLDARTELPSFAVVTPGVPYDVRVAKESFLPLSRDSILVVDKGYLDFAWLYSLTCQGVYFVIRTRENMKYRVVGQQASSRAMDVLADEEIELTQKHSRSRYPGKLRLVTYYDQQEKRVYRFMTNNTELAASTIARIYQARWEIEVFFKWIKQNLKIKTFLGTSPNAVLTQIWTALVYYLLLAYIKYQTSYYGTLTTLTRVLKESVGMRRDIIDLLKASLSRVVKLRDPCQQPALL